MFPWDGVGRILPTPKGVCGLRVSVEHRVGVQFNVYFVVGLHAACGSGDGAAPAIFLLGRALVSKSAVYLGILDVV